jgi:Ras-related protein Rab-6A
MPRERFIYFSFQEKRVISTEEGEAKAKELGILFVETSAKTGYNIKQLFKRAALALPGLDKNEDEESLKQDDSILTCTFYSLVM